MALTTVAKVKAHLKKTDTTDDALLAALVLSAQAMIEKYCQRHFDAADYGPEYYDGNGECDLLLNEFPLISITSLYVDAERVYGSDCLLVEGTDFVKYKDEGRIELLTETTGSYVSASGFVKAPLAVKVSYRAGYATIPYDLELAANEMVAFLFNNRGVVRNVQSQSIGGYSESFGNASAAVAIPSNVVSLIESYRNFSMELRRSTT